MDYFGAFVSVIFLDSKLDLTCFHLAQRVPLAFTIEFLQITCVVEDDKVRSSPSLFNEYSTNNF